VSLTVRTDRALVRAATRSTRYLWIELVAPEAPRRQDRAPVNVALVLDRSGSMAGARKFPLARQAAEHALKLLHSDDRFSLVVYDDRIDILAESQPATPDAIHAALSALELIGPREATDLCAGWLRGCEQIARYLDDRAIGRCLLLTDGLANRGTTDHATIVQHGAELRARGVATSTFGVGADFDEALLRDMAVEGGGNNYFIEQPEQITDFLTSELGEALETVMRGVQVSIALPHGARAMCLNRYRSRYVENDRVFQVELGDLVSSQVLSIVAGIEFDSGEAGLDTMATVSVHTSDGAAFGSEHNIRWHYDTHAANETQPRDLEVDIQVATLYAARARAEATEHNRRGDYESARSILQRTAAKIRSYAGNDPRLLAIATSLEGDVPEFAMAMSVLSHKRHFHEALHLTRSRGPGGAAVRREK